MAGTVKCQKPIGDTGKKCVLKKGHDPAIPCRPRTTAPKINADAVASSITLVTDPDKLVKVKRTRTVETSGVTRLAALICDTAHAAWLKAGKPVEWAKTPAATVTVKESQESAMRARIHDVAGKGNRKATIGQPEKLDGGNVRLYVQVRDLPKPSKPESAETKPAAKPAPKPSK